MAFHREIKVNYQVLEMIVQSLKKYESALETMQRSIASMDRIIAENEGKTFTALSKIKHDFDDEIIECKDEVKDLYSSISNYVSDMKGIIYAPSAGRMTLVDRNDIYLNMKAIKLACESIRGVGSSEYGSTLNTDNYEAGSDALNKILSDVNRTARMRAAIEASSKKIDNLYDKIETIYKTKIVKYENKDDSHASKMRKIHSKYTNQEEARREGEEASTDFAKGVFAWFKDLALGVFILFMLDKAIDVYVFCKIFGIKPPDWSKKRIEGLKGVTPITLIESICQSASDAAAEKGYAYGAGYVATEVAITILGYGAANRLVSSTDDIARAVRGADKIDEIGDAARGADKVDDLGGAGKGADKVDDSADISKSNSMPNCHEAETPREKFVDYSLDYNNPNARGKAEAYEKGLGYTKNNADTLISQIHDYVSSGNPPYKIEKTQYGVKYKYRIPVTGPNGKTKNVIAVYQIDKGKTSPRLVTNYLEGK